jgi:hypothetical protein
MKVLSFSTLATFLGGIRKMALTQSTLTALMAVAATADEMQRAIARLRCEVDDARRAGASWESIGSMIGTTGEAARQRFGPKRPAPRPQPTEVLFVA